MGVHLHHLIGGRGAARTVSRCHGLICIITQCGCGGRPVVSVHVVVNHSVITVAVVVSVIVVSAVMAIAIHMRAMIGI